MRTGTKFWLGVGIGIVFPLIIFFALLFKGFAFDAVSLGIILGAPVTVFTAFGILNVKASGQAVARNQDQGKGVA